MSRLDYPAQRETSRQTLTEWTTTTVRDCIPPSGQDCRTNQPAGQPVTASRTRSASSPVRFSVVYTTSTSWIGSQRDSLRSTTTIVRRGRNRARIGGGIVAHYGMSGMSTNAAEAITGSG
jgi:hypothetical protein